MAKRLCLFELVNDLVKREAWASEKEFGQFIIGAIISLDKRTFISRISPEVELDAEARKSLAREFIKKLGLMIDIRDPLSDTRVNHGVLDYLSSPRTISDFITTYQPSRKEGVEYQLQRALISGVSYELIGQAFKKAARDHFTESMRKTKGSGLKPQFYWNLPKEYHDIEEKFLRLYK